MGDGSGSRPLASAGGELGGGRCIVTSAEVGGTVGSGGSAFCGKLWQESRRVDRSTADYGRAPALHFSPARRRGVTGTLGTPAGGNCGPVLKRFEGALRPGSARIPRLA